MKLEVIAAVIVAVMVESDAVELFKRIHYFSHGRGKPRVQRDTLRFRGANVHALAFLHVPEIWRLDSTALVRDDGRLRVSQQRPLGWSEEGVCLNIGGTGPRAKTAELVLD